MLARDPTFFPPRVVVSIRDGGDFKVHEYELLGCRWDLFAGDFIRWTDSIDKCDIYPWRFGRNIHVTVDNISEEHMGMWMQAIEEFCRYYGQLRQIRIAP